jgi:tape measure domain-containing protein
MAAGSGMVAGEVTARLNLDPTQFNTTLAAAWNSLKAIKATPHIVQLQMVQRAGVAASTATANAAVSASRSSAAGVAALATSQQRLQTATSQTTAAIAQQAAAYTPLRSAVQIAMGQNAAMVGGTRLQTAAQIAMGKSVGQTASSVRSAASQTAGAAQRSATYGQALQGIADKSKTASAGLDKMAASAKHSEVSFSTLTKTLLKASTVFIGIMALKAAIEAVGGAIKATVAEAARFEQVAIGFEHIYGGARKAKKMLEDLANFAKTTPFELVNVEQAALRLKAYGFAAEQVIPMLTDVGDATSALGTGQEGINRITLALGQMRSAGRMNSRDMLQLTEAFVPAWDYVAQALNTTTGRVREMTEKGLVPAELAIAAIRKGMQKDFGGMMSAQMDTLNQMVSNLKDEFTLAAREVGTKMLPALKKIVAWASDALPKFKAFFLGAIEGSNNFGKAIRNIGVVINTFVIPAIKFIADAVGLVVSTVTDMLAGDWEGIWKDAAKSPLAVVIGLGAIIVTVQKITLFALGAQKALQGLALWQAGAGLAGLGASGTLAAGGLGAATGATTVLTGAAAKLAAVLSTVLWPAIMLVAGFISQKFIGEIAAAKAGFESLSDAAKTGADNSASFGERFKAGLVTGFAGLPGTLKNLDALVRENISEKPFWDGWFQSTEKAKSGVAGLSTEMQKINYDMLVARMNSDAWSQSLQDQADALMETANAASSLNSVQLDYVKDAKAVFDAEQNLIKAKKEHAAGSGEVVLAELELAAAQETAAESMKVYQSRLADLALTQKYGGEMAQWAGRAAVEGANATNKAMSSIMTTLYNASEAWNTYGAAAANAFNSSKRAGDQLAQSFRLGELAYDNSVFDKASAIVGEWKEIAFTPVPVPKFSAAQVGGSGGGAKSGVDKITTAIEKLRDALMGAIDKVKELADSFKNAAVEAAGAAGTMGEKVSRRGTRGITSALRSQVRKLEKYRDSLNKLKAGLPQGIFEDFVIPASMDDVIGMARLNLSRLQNLIGQRAAVGVEIANVTQAPRIRKATAEITADTYAAARKVGASVTINFGGVTIGSNMSAEQFAKQLATVINRELRAAGMVV